MLFTVPLLTLRLFLDEIRSDTERQWTLLGGVLVRMRASKSAYIFLFSMGL